MKQIKNIAVWLFGDIINCDDYNDFWELEMMEEDMYMSFIAFEDSKNKVNAGVNTPGLK